MHTEVTLKRDENKFSLLAVNHTESKVCAAVSGLIQALEGWIMNFPDHVIDPHIIVTSGSADISFIGDAEAEAAFMCILIGLKRIELGYPGKLTVIDHT